MKIYYQSRLIVITLFLGLVFIKSIAINYTISFTGSGASTTIDSVIVQNLTKGTSVKVLAGNVLNLSDSKTAIEQISTTDESISVYPSSVAGKYTISFFSKEVGATQLNVYSIDGRKLNGIICNLQEGRNLFQLALPKGAFIITINGLRFSYSSKLISYSGLETKPEISFTGNEKVNSTIKLKSKNVGGVITMLYTANDQLLYKGYSANFCTIVTDKPTDNKTINFEFVENKEIPEYTYDKTKIFWDDTHLRWMQLRGAVKEMKVSQINYWGTTSDPMTVHYLFRLNIKGFLTSSLSSWGDSVSMGYDNLNRITTMIDYPGTNSISGIVTGGVGEKYTDRYTFSYGNHTKYYRIGFNDAGSSPFLCYMTDENFGMGDNFYEGFWVKGLTGITSKDATFNISVFNDSIMTKESYGTNYNYTTTLFYKGSFPNLEIRKIDNNSKNSPGDIFKTFFSFSENGQLQKYLEDRYLKWSNKYYKNWDSIEYKVSTPFQLYTIKHEGSAVGGVRKFKYDTNHNVIEDEWTLGSDNTVITTYFNYVSYDEKGNWTQCIVIENDNRWPDNDKIWKLTREFKYW
jgi:hypothetical protein